MQDIDLTGKVALVTGSSRGLGRHYALTLAHAGADVLIHDVHERAAAAFGEASSGPAVAYEVRALGRHSAFFAADLTSTDQVAALSRQAVDGFGRIDILVNNAGGGIGARTPRPDPNDALDIHGDDIRAVVERNLLTTMYTCTYVGRHMRARRSGKMVNVGSLILDRWGADPMLHWPHGKARPRRRAGERRPELAGARRRPACRRVGGVRALATSTPCRRWSSLRRQRERRAAYRLPPGQCAGRRA